MAEQWLRIRNWDKWQSYRKDRTNQPWIKLHRALQQNVDWVSLSDAQRGQLVAIWMLAASRSGLIPASAATIRKLCFMDSDPDLQLFIDKGFIERLPSGCQVDNQVSQDGCQVDALDKRREEENREEEIREEGADARSTTKRAGLSVDDLSFPPSLDSPEARNAIGEWIEYKRSRGQPYKKPAHLNKLLEQYARDGPKVLIEAVNHSIACNYQGVFRPGGTSGNGGRSASKTGAGQRFDPDAKTGGTF